MRNLSKLRARLRAALFAVPLGAAACGTPAKQPNGPTVVGNDPDSGGMKGPVAEVPFPNGTGGCGGGGAWCGPRAQVEKVMQPEATIQMDCPSYFRLEDRGLYFSLDQQATQQQRDDGNGTTCCYYYNDGCVEGRPYEDGEGALVVPVARGAALALAPDVAALPDALRLELAGRWLRSALAEHASIASFARAQLELLALGAPMRLVAAHARAAIEETRHAERSFALASRYLGRALTPAPLPALAPRATDLARFTADLFAEGCVNETISALIAAREAAACADPHVGPILQAIARDEESHADLAWETLAWALRQGAPMPASAPRPQASGPEGEPDRVLLAFGRLDQTGRRQAAADAWRDVILPSLRDLYFR